MKHSVQERVLALAGVFQSALLTSQLARRGFADQRPYNASFRSLFVTDPGATEAVYGDAANLRPGLEIMLATMSRGEKPDPDVLRYTMTMMQLEKKVSRNPEILKRIGDELESLRQEDPTLAEPGREENVSTEAVSRIAQLYRDTISDLSPRVMVNGEPDNLADMAIAGRIRAILLAGIRSAILWRQVGGRPWHFVFSRGELTNAAKQWMLRSSNAA